MIVKAGPKNIVLHGVRDFSIEQILECGQCFNFNKLSNNEYELTAYDKYLHVSQIDTDVTLYNTNSQDYENIWKRYFDMDTDYADIKSKLVRSDSQMEEIITMGEGIRLLNQNFFETLISFIISQNKQIPHIKQIIHTISERYGNKIMKNENEVAYAFPNVEIMNQISEEELRACKTGFRAPYIRHAVSMVYNGIVTEEQISRLDYNSAKELLLTIKGVGEKVANCVLLFGLGYRNAFPVDVWMKRIMEKLYFGKETSKDVIEEYAYDKFGELSGYAQQYMFYYAIKTKLL